MLKTALYNTHLALGAKMVEFAGYEMPVRYTSLGEEHMAVRESVGVFDVSHMGEFLIEGKGALALLQKVSSNDVAKLVDGQAMYSCMPNEQGGIVDDLIIYRRSANSYFLVVNASNIQKDWDWIRTHNHVGADMTDVSDMMSLIAVQGPKAIDVLQRLTTTILSNIEYYHFTEGSMAGIDDIIISATGYTGSGGFELYVKNKDAEKLWNTIFEKAGDIHILPAGLGARDTLRLEKGFCLYGNDIDDHTSPLEAGLGWITKFNHDFVNSTALKAQKEKGLERKLIGFIMNDKGIPRHDYEIINMDGDIIGKVTSGTQSPMLDKGIGMGYVKTEYAKTGNEIAIQIRKNQLPATIVKVPFV